MSVDSCIELLERVLGEIAKANDEEGPISVDDLARRVGAHYSSVLKYVQALMKRGLVRRDEQGGLMLTLKGWEIARVLSE